MAFKAVKYTKITVKGINMRAPQKTNLVYKTLKNNILSGKLLPGMQLPPETELAKNMNVGRITLRSALKKLEAESLVKRIERKGTFVRLQQVMPSLTLLIPCEDYIEKAGYGSIMTTQMILNGMISTAQQHGYQVRTLAVSKSNSIDDIDYDALDTLDENSKIVIIGVWFKPLFEYLSQKGCNAVNITALSNYTAKMKKLTSSWNFIHFGLEDVWEKAAKILQSRGCSQVAIATNSPQTPCAIRTGFMRVFDENTLLFNIDGKDIYNDFCKALQNFYEKNNFDGLLLNYTNFSHVPLNNFGLPANVKIIMELPIGVDAPDFAEWFRCPVYEAGKQAAQLLIDNKTSEIRHVTVKLNAPSLEAKIPDIIL